MGLALITTKKLHEIATSSPQVFPFMAEQAQFGQALITSRAVITLMVSTELSQIN